MTRGVFSANSQLTAAELNDCFDPPRCRLTNSGNQSITNNAGAALTFDTEIVDDGGMHSTSSNTSRITVPTGGDGFYIVTGNAQFDANATGIRDLSIRLNGATTIATSRLISSSASSDSRLSVTTMYPLVAGDYLELFAFQNSGGALNVESASEYTPIFAAVWVAVA